MAASCPAACVGTWSVEKTLLATWELSRLWGSSPWGDTIPVMWQTCRRHVVMRSMVAGWPGRRTRSASSFFRLQVRVSPPDLLTIGESMLGKAFLGPSNVVTSPDTRTVGSVGLGCRSTSSLRSLFVLGMSQSEGAAISFHLIFRSQDFSARDVGP